MASVLKVDTLQKPDGSTPTAADLGIDVAGSVVQVKHHTWTGEESVSVVNTWTDINSSSFTYTPKYANSSLIIMATPAINRNNNSSGSQGGCSYRIVVDNVAQGLQTDYHELYMNTGTGSTVDIYHRPLKTVGYALSSANPINIKIQLAQYANGGFSKVNQSSKWQSEITVLEIAQ